MREIRPSGLEGGARFQPRFLPLSGAEYAGFQPALQSRHVVRRWLRLAFRRHVAVSVHRQPQAL